MTRRVGLALLVLIAVVAAVYLIAHNLGNGWGGSAWPVTPEGDMAAFERLTGEQPPADLTFVDGDGDERRLSDFAGRTVLLNLWATWCTPCLKEMPTLDALQGELGGRDFTVLALSVDKGDKGVEKARAFLAKINAEHLGLYVDTSARAASRFGAPGLPTTYLIDPEGQLVGRLTGEADWASDEAKRFLQAIIEAEQKPSSQPE